MTPKKESAGGYETTTADTNNTTVIIPFRARCRLVFIRFAGMLATFFRGLA
jgi:hypothetical protein